MMLRNKSNSHIPDEIAASTIAYMPVLSSPIVLGINNLNSTQYQKRKALAVKVLLQK